MNNPFSVLFLTSWYPTSEYPTHGIFIKNHAKALARYCNVVVLYVYASEETDTVILEHTQNEKLNEYIIAFPKSKIPVFRSIIHFLKYLYYYYKLSKLVKKHFDDVQFAQINVVYPVAVFFSFIKKMYNIKHYTVFEQWTGYLKEDNLYKGFFRKYITKRTIEKASIVWCLCEYQKKAMINHCLNGKYSILGNVVDTEVFQVKRINNSIKKFLHISTLDDRQKNITGILKVFSEIQKAGYVFELVIVGGRKKDIEKAKKTAEILGLRNVKFTGIVNQKELPYYYQSADALVMFSNYETFCVVVYEALSCGTYVITSNVADLDKIVSEKFGALVSPGNEEELKQAILNVLENKVNCASEEAHTFIENNFSEEIIGKKLFEHYCSLIS